MNRVYICLAAAVVFMLAGGAIAVAGKPATPERVQIVADQNSETVRILIKGKEIVVIDETGLYVRGDVAYKGTITDGLPPRLSGGSHAE